MEYPQDQSYFPSAKVRLNIRFDEFQDVTKLKILDPKMPKLPPQLFRRGQKGYKAPLEVKPDPSSPPGINRLILLPKTGQSSNQNSPQSQDVSADKLTHLIGGIIPKSAILGRNGIRTADTLTLNIRYIDLPIDPRIIRSCGVEFYLGTLKEEDYLRGIDGGRTEGQNGAFPGNFLPDTYTDEYGQERTNLRFLGFVDKWSVDWSKEGEPMVTLECRDNTNLLMDQNAPPNLRINPKLPIDKAIATYMSNFPRFSGLSIEYRPGGVEVPNLAGALAGTAFRPPTGGSAAPDGNSFGGPPAASEQSVFDYFTDMVGALGHTIRITGTIVVIQRIVTQTSSDFVGANRPDDPYKPRQYENGKIMEVRNMIYGRNIKTMKVSRGFTVNSLQNVEVRSYSPKRKKVLVARFPKVGDVVYNTTIRPGDIVDQKWNVYRIGPLVEDLKTLRIIAQSIYETNNLSSFGGGNLDPDILDIEATDTIEVYVNRDEEQFNSSTAIENIMLLQNRAVQYLTALGYSGDFADAYAKSYANVGFQTRFRVKNVTFNWDMNNGVELSLECVNFIEIRGEKFTLPPGEQITQKQTAGTSPGKTTQTPLLPNPGLVMQLDVQSMRNLLKGEIDTREWVSYGIVQTDSTEDDRPIDFSPLYGPMVNVTLQPAGVDVRARVTGFIAGNGEGCWYPFLPGDEVLVVCVGGRYENAVIVGRLNQQIDAFPTVVAGNPVDTNTFGFWRLVAPFVIESKNTFQIINPVTTSAFIMEEGGNVTIRDGELSFLHIGADFLGLQTNDGGLLLQMNIESNTIRIAHNNDPGQPSVIFDLNGVESKLATGGTLSIGTAGNFAAFHAITLESVIAILASYSAVIGAGIAALGVPFGPLAPLFASPGPLSGLPGAISVEPALAAAVSLPINDVFQQTLNQLMSVPKTIGVPNIGCIGLQLG